MPDLNRILDQIDRLDQQATKGPWVVHPAVKYIYTIDAGMVLDRAWADQPDADLRLAALARAVMPALAQAVKGVLGVLDDYEVPGKLHDPTGYAAAELETLEGYIREAITEALGGDIE